MNIKIDNRKITWKELESDIAQYAKKKDKNFKLSGSWKIFERKQDGFSIYRVDGEWVRANLSIIFGHGGHGYVHEFIPHEEIWVDVKHYSNCDCKKVAQKRLISQRYFESTVVHEITEWKKMKTGISFWKAHHIGLQAENNLKLLLNQYTEDYSPIT